MIESPIKPKKKVFIARRVRASCDMIETQMQKSEMGEFDSVAEFKIPKSYMHLGEISKLNESGLQENDKIDGDIEGSS